MLKSILSAAALAAFAASAHAATPAASLADLGTQSAEAPTGQDSYQTASYCEWITVYDYWGNWVTYWQCY
ncbi:MAG: hypothetical protein RIG84_03425 [Roseovarius sp.]